MLSHELQLFVYRNEVRNTHSCISRLQLRNVFERRFEAVRLSHTYESLWTLEGFCILASQQGCVEQFISSLSENNVRIFLARSTTRLTLPHAGMHITL